MTLSGGAGAHSILDMIGVVTDETAFALLDPLDRIGPCGPVPAGALLGVSWRHSATGPIHREGAATVGKRLDATDGTLVRLVHRRIRGPSANGGILLRHFR